MEKIEKQARIFNLLSLVFCIISLYMNISFTINLLVSILLALQIVHILFGDVTDSYRLLMKKKFLVFYTAALFLFFLIALFAISFLELRLKFSFVSLLFSFIFDFTANKVRVQGLKLGKNKNKKRRRQT